MERSQAQFINHIAVYMIFGKKLVGHKSMPCINNKSE